MPDNPYTIMSAALERATRDEKDVFEVEGELVAHHQYHILKVLRAHAVERASLQAKARQLSEELTVAQAALETIDGRMDAETRHDREVLAAYVREAPQFQDNRMGKSFPMAWGRLYTKRHTRPAGATLVDEQAALAAYPEFKRVTEKTDWAALKKALTITDEGQVLDASGQPVPPNIIIGTAKSSEVEAFVEVGGVTFTLQGGMLSGDDTDTDEPSAEGPDLFGFDPFA